MGVATVATVALVTEYFSLFKFAEITKGERSVKPEQKILPVRCK